MSTRVSEMRDRVQDIGREEFAEVVKDVRPLVRKYASAGRKQVSSVVADVGPLLRRHTGKVVIGSLALGCVVGWLLHRRA